MERLGPRAFNDVYHQPKPMTTPKPAYDPHQFLKGCITTSGGDNYHYEGQRKYTVREMSLFQSFPYHYQFSGTYGQAMKQVGNAFPPVIAEAVYRSVVMTLEAFDNGLIGSEDNLSDLEGIFAQMRLNASRTPSTSPSLFEASSRSVRPSSSRVNRESDPSSMHLLLDGSNSPLSAGEASPNNREAMQLEDDDGDDDDVIFLGCSRRVD